MMKINKKERRRKHRIACIENNNERKL